MPKPITEDTVEYAVIDWLKVVGYGYIHGGEITPREPATERDSYVEEACTAAETRDALLPRLVSGELRVGEIE